MSQLDTTVVIPTRQGDGSPDVNDTLTDVSETAGGGWRRAAYAALATWTAALAMYAVITVFAWRLTKAQTPTIPEMFGMYKWQDATFYIEIMELGYHNNPDSLAFYPLFSMVSWVFNVVLPGGPLIAVAVVSALCAFVTLMLLFRFVDMEFGTETAHRALLYFAAFPMAFYLYNGYNASMCVMFIIGAMYAGRRGHWWLAGVLTCLAGSTRLFGLLVAVALAYEYMRQRDWNVRRIRWDVLSFAIMPLGLVAFSVYCRVVHGDWLAFVHAQDSWKRAYGWPGQSLIEPFRRLYHAVNEDGPFIPNEYMTITAFEAVTVLLVLVLVVLGFVGPWKVRRDQWFLLIATIVPLILVTSTMIGDQRWLTSAPRFTLEWLAPFVILARIGRNMFIDRLVLMLALSLQAIMLATFALHVNWVA
ncbi:glycosyltransferase 87 family protein [Actinoplanes sp. NPDC051861]|uniref:glycosyltransferase 87 family protein n=1 Tax=Actinoplanes sp. NPDC051861 TaxID=3155170 RepID=UPI003441A9AC